MGVGAAVRLQRQRNARPEAEQLDRLARALGLETLMTEPRHSVQDIITERNQTLAEGMLAYAADVAEALTERMLRPALAEAGVEPSGYAVGYTIIDEPNPDDVPYPTVESVEVDPEDGWLTLKYAPHISLGTVPIPADQCRALRQAVEAEFGPIPTGPGPYGDGDRGPDTLAADALDSWDGNPWHDPNEAAALRAEAIDRALDDDHPNEES